MNNPLSLLDLTKEEDLLKPIANNLFSRVYQTGLAGRGLAHLSYLNGDRQEHSFQQHGVVVHLKPERNSQRCLGGLLESENIDIGDMAIIPTNVSHWHQVETEVSEQIVITIEPDIFASIAHEVINPDRLELIPTFAQPDPLVSALGAKPQGKLRLKQLRHTLCRIII